ncbi:MAG: carbonic anhydrase [Planctomycetota bacterium]|nr:MAG: carbonic anhydrase [Planctomycetota bacterium]
MRTVHRDEQELFTQLATGQEPDVFFITCSDSRIDPNLITQTKPGDLFVLRNAGNIVPPHGAIRGGEEATVEYAVSVLGVRDIVVCGHADCGAMKGLLHPESCRHLPAVSRWLEQAEPVRQIVQTQLQDEDEEQRLRKAIELNVLQQLTNLRTHPAVAARLFGGSLALHGWVWDIRSGGVRAFDTTSGAFLPLTEMREVSSEEESDSASQVA